MTKEEPQHIAWIDTESNGLSSTQHDVLEVACVVTDLKLNVLGECSYVVMPPVLGTVDYTKPSVRAASLDTLKSAANDYVLKLHTENGLWEDVVERGLSPARVQEELRIFLEGFRIKAHGAYLGGASVHFDEKMLSAEGDLKHVLEFMHHRHIDVSVMKNMLKFWNPRALESLPAWGEGVVHRALPDIIRTLEEARILKGHVQAISSLHLAAQEAVSGLTPKEQEILNRRLGREGK